MLQKFNSKRGCVGEKRSLIKSMVKHKSSVRVKYMAFIALLISVVTVSASAKADTMISGPKKQDDNIVRTAYHSMQKDLPLDIINFAVLTTSGIKQGTEFLKQGQDKGVADYVDRSVTTGFEAEQAEATICNEKVPLSNEMQLYLYDLCKERELDYVKVLGIIQTESKFNSDAISKSNDYGLCQINICNHANLSKILGTENKPLDAKINLNWGTYLLSYLKDRYSDKYEGEVLWEVVLSAYNKGEGGFKKHGLAQDYIRDYNESLAVVNAWF